MDEKSNEKKRDWISRRRFIGTMGAAAAAAGALQSGRSQNAASQAYYFQDSFGNVVPVDPALIDFGLYPPSISGGDDDALTSDTGATGFSTGYPAYNILLIVVDQMRNPAFWLPSGNNWLSTYVGILPNITGLARRWSFLFPNYFVAATACTPSRACPLSGLYSQQTCVFQTFGPAGANNCLQGPPLLPFNPGWNSNGDPAGFPTIGNVLSQSFNGQNGYNCTWIGKWHLSCESGVPDGTPGQNGPSDYGFNSNYNIPTASNVNPYPAGTSSRHLTYPSPNGVMNEGSGGDFLDSFTQATPAHNYPNFGWNNNNAPVQFNNNEVQPAPNFSQVNDAAIAYAFTNYWLPNANNNLNGGTGNNGQLLTPWFCAVSFINPHDISDFPWNAGSEVSYGSNQFPPPAGGNSGLAQSGYQPAPKISGNNNYLGSNYSGSDDGSDPSGDTVHIRNFPTPYNSSLPPGTGNNSSPWNYEASLTAKPWLQSFFQAYIDSISGRVQAPGYNSSLNTYATPEAWETFLNYYAWLQSNVDYQVGQVLTALSQSSFNNNTVVIFTSDHGEYAGSHGLHDKAGALYEESLNVPLLISFPQLRNANNSNNGSPLVLPYACSSVDLLPFLYTLALGNEGWRNNSDDMIYHLAGRESLFDAIYYYNNNISYYPYPGIQHRRISGIPLYNNTSGNNDWQLYQPFVLHTTDEFPLAGSYANNNFQPSHAIGLRTVDQTEITADAAPFFDQYTYGGGKLGVYSFWATSNGSNAPIQGIFYDNNVSVQYEFYNYSPSRNNNSANPQEVGNEFWAGNNVSAPAAPYFHDFFNIGNNNGVVIQDELYLLNTGGSNSNTMQQVQAAIQTAFNNYISYLEYTNQMTDNNGWPRGGNNNNDFCSAGASNNMYSW